jgi:hypothetical protein
LALSGKRARLPLDRASPRLQQRSLANSEMEKAVELRCEHYNYSAAKHAATCACSTGKLA